MKEKLVKFNVISTSGDDEFTLAPREALDKIRSLQKSKGKWLYLDGEYTNADQITEAELVTAETVTMTNALAGGARFFTKKGVRYKTTSHTKYIKEKKLVFENDIDLGEPSFKVVTAIKDKMESSVDIFLDLETEKITVNIFKDDIFALSRHIDQVSTLLNYELGRTAAEEVNGVAQAYGRAPVVTVPGNPKTTISSVVKFEAAPKAKKDEKAAVMADISIGLGSLMENEVAFIVKDDPMVVSLRRFIVAALDRKVKEFVAKEIAETREVYQI